MTNHPHRKRPDVTAETEAAAEALAGQLVPAESGDIPPQGSAEVPAHTGNGVPPGLRPNAAKLIGAAVAEALGQSLPQMLFQAFGGALSQVPVQAVTRQHLCSACLLQRITWEQRNQSAMEKAIADACAAAGAEPGTPQAAQLDLTVFLPADLRPGAPGGMPAVQEAVTTVQGAEVCPMHIPGVQAGRSPLLVAHGSMSPAMLGQLAGTR